MNKQIAIEYFRDVAKILDRDYKQANGQEQFNLLVDEIASHYRKNIPPERAADLIAEIVGLKTLLKVN